MNKGKILFPILLTGLVVTSFPLTLDSFQIRDVYKRVIAEKIGEAEIELLKSKGCFLKHRLKDFTSFECPQNIETNLNLRESRIFYIQDLDADKQIEADKVWAEGITGNEVKVAILDTGIDTDHPELQDSYLGGYDYVNNDAYPEDDHGHGSHVAGIITSNGTSNSDSKGVAPDAGIYMYKVCNANGACYEDDLIAAMEDAVLTDAKIMSISIGGGSYASENCDSDSLASKVNWVVDQGLTVVVAAGNDGKGVSSPACASKAIAVGAVDKSNNIPYWSGRGNALDIVAPGVSIYSTYLNGGYGSMSGTSMATPHVSGVISLLLETDSNLTTDEIKTALYNTASPVNKCYECIFWWRSSCYAYREVSCKSNITGAGIANAYEAYLAVKPSTPECEVDTDCNDEVSCTDDSCIDNSCVFTPNNDYCSADGWVDTGETRWISTGQCSEKEQKEQEYRNYYCDLISDCQYNVTDNQWINTGVERDKADGSSCEDGQFCTENDYCSSGVCQSGSSKTCNDDNECTSDSCDEANNICLNESVADNTSCSGGICCSGNCSTPDCSVDTDCNDNDVCTTDSCNNAGICSAYCSFNPVTSCINDDGCCPAGCSYETDNDCSSGQLCWSGTNEYLYRNSRQAKKFCKCAMGVYGYNSYSYIWGRETVFRYDNTGDNENWDVNSRSSFLPVYQVICSDGTTYQTNQDYYYSN